jgi:hypothetical protein
MTPGIGQPAARGLREADPPLINHYESLHRVGAIDANAPPDMTSRLIGVVAASAGEVRRSQAPVRGKPAHKSAAKRATRAVCKRGRGGARRSRIAMRSWPSAFWRTQEHRCAARRVARKRK